MKRFSAVLAMGVILLFACIFAAGCASRDVPGTPVTATLTPAPVSSPGTTYTVTSAPGPTQIMPADEAVSVTVSRNTITTDPTITTTFNGGMGLGMTERMDVTVIRTDGTEEKGNRDNPQMGTTVTLMGDVGTDRVIVNVTMTSGDQYTLVNRDYPFPGGGSTA